jgi:homospermidine synthase
MGLSYCKEVKSTQSKKIAINTKMKDRSPRFLLIGFGAIGQGLAPLLVKALQIAPSRITAWAADLEGAAVAQAAGIRLQLQPLSPDNYAPLLAAHLRPGDVLLNLAVEVGSFDLIAWCQQHDVLYLDTSIEPWPGGYMPHRGLERNTNQWLRHQVLTLQRPNRTTAVVAHGANPGLISHLTKRALKQLAHDRGLTFAPGQWANLAKALGVQVIQVAERDTQTSRRPVAPDEFCNTWSVPGFINELAQDCEAGWGSHETQLPNGAQFPSVGSKSNIYWPHPQHGLVEVKSWLPSVGESVAWLVTHNESISLAEFLTEYSEQGQVTYRPTVYFAYQPCPQACQSIAHWLGKHKQAPSQQSVMPPADLQQGQDELGVLLCHGAGAYWYGSTLSVQAARAMAPHNSATTLQVVAGIVGAVTWMLEHPRSGVTEAEAMDSDQVLDVALPYLGLVGGTHTHWQPGPDLRFQNFQPFHKP